MTEIESGYESQPFVAELYDHIGPYRNRPDLTFYKDMARGTGGPVLELGCGTGRVLLPLARAGFDIVGLDLSPHMLDICQSKVERESKHLKGQVELIQGDMRDFNFKQHFNLVITPFRTFQHLLDVDDQMQCLRAVHNHLSKDGRFVLDIFNPAVERLAEDNLGEVFSEDPPFQMPDGRRVIRKHKITARDLFKQILYVELIYHITYPDGHSEDLVHAFPMRYLFRYEAEHLLARCGFHVEEVYGSYDRSAYGDTYPGELIFLARQAG